MEKLEKAWGKKGGGGGGLVTTNKVSYRKALP